MKGTVLLCLKELVATKFGEPAWERVLRRAGQDPYTMFAAQGDVDDAIALEIIEATCAELEITVEQAGDAFGDHWVNTYAPRLYASYFRKHTSARTFLVELNEMHARLTRSLPGAKPPKFRFEWTQPETLVMHYQSHRQLIDIAVGMTRALGTRFKEKLVVRRMTATSLEVRFPRAD